MYAQKMDFDTARPFKQTRMAQVSESLPDYETRLAVRHAVFDDTFRRIIHACPVGGRVLDIGCGDGYFMNGFLRAGRWHSVTGLDPSAAYLRVARSHITGDRPSGFLMGTGEHLPYADETFDLVWSAHSMQSYDDAMHTIGEAHRILKRGGSIAILENDRLHARVLPLSPSVEIALMKKRIAQISKGAPGKAFQARWCEQYLESVGFSRIRRTTYVLEQQTPWDDSTQQFYELILEDLLEEARERLSGRLLAVAEDTLSPDSKNYLGKLNYRFFCELHTLFIAVKT